DRATVPRRPGPRLHPPGRRRHAGLAGRPPRPEGDRLLLPGREHARLHQAGLRLPRLAGRAGRRRARRARDLPRPAGQAGEVPGRGGADLPAAVRPGAHRADRLGRVRREDDVRQEGHRRDPVHLRGGRGGPHRAGPLQRQGHRPRRRAAQEALGL
ncbi:MAG: Thiol peroxidase, Bcp-type, partial [uncultured Corynebacteriales bacterium]